VTPFSREEEMRPMVAAWMEARGLTVRGQTIIWHLCDMVGCEFDPEMVRRRLKRQRPWQPLAKRLVAVELKLSRIVEALHQAYNNLCAVHESYTAFPADVAARIAAKPERWAKYWAHGIGVLGVTADGCEVVIAAKPTPPTLGHANGQAEKFWRDYRRKAKETQT